MPINAKTKIQLHAIEQAHRALDALPEHRPEEVTKTQAIQKLIVPIRATQAKGYSLAAIGKVLAESGISITTGALRAYISEANAGADGHRKPKAKRAAKALKETRSGAAPSNLPAAKSQPAEAAAKPAAAATIRAVDLDWEPAARSNLAPSPGASLHGFHVRPDTKDL